ncbi:CRISPR-associated helicase Cas3' [Lentilactobacillus parafarraginis]|uniref:CRISPR-associated helicase Cas3 n=1 Tax=Lentilactobacillus parafarraginis TaxID=390842 RepID=A0A5R9CVX1_9LACO|nr:CRISPR-associated helicase Cas3' [Lentilactobacillus parafarraginis]TLQ19670.1 CRISPR-associated helicase Cas3' [Lentilactobacillus parafarraginis]
MNLQKNVTALWAKKSFENNQQLWLPLITHLTDTSNVINWLYTHWLSEKQRELLLVQQSPNETSEEADADTQKLIKFIGFSHDIGKATAAFQEKQSYIRDDSLDNQLLEKLARSGFSNLEDKLSNPRASPHALAGEAILEKMKVPKSIGAIIGGHHGKPAEFAPKKQISTYTANYYLSDNDPKIQAVWKQTQKDLFDYGLKLSGYQSVAEIPDVNQPQAVILEGLLIMADWLASSEYLDAGKTIPLFPLISLDQSYEDVDSTHRFRNAITNWKRSDEWVPQKVSTDQDPYKARWGFDARPVQKTITDAISKTHDPGMVIVEAPTGLGKTEIALVAAEQLAYIDGEDGVFMGLPTQATTNAMFDRVNDWLEKLAESQDETVSIKLMHGKAQFNRHYQELPSASNVDDPDAPDNKDLGSVTVNSWFSGKKSILTKFTVGTIDHLLLMALKQKHLFLRHLGLSGKVVVIDEVHAYDAYMNQYLYRAITWLGAYHVPIVILSATLPKEKRNALIDAYLEGKYGRKNPKGFDAPTDWRQTEAYPLLSILDGKKLKQVTEFKGKSDQKPFKLQIKKINPDDEELIQDVLAKISDGGIAGIVVNTVKRAQKLAELVPKDVKLMILHSSFTAPGREIQEETLQKAIGKGGKRPPKMIVIGTQVLEQSLDIDFDVLYTDIAPIDLILQRAGRLHRHQIDRPKQLQKPQLFVMGINGPGDYGDANKAVYQTYLLMKTDYFLNDSIAIPDDVSKLVQAVYDQTNDDEISESDMPELNRAKKAFFDYIHKESEKADVFRIDEPQDDETIHNWLGHAQPDIDKDEQRAAAAVRDIKETLEVVLLQHTNQGDFLITDGNPAHRRSIKDVSPRDIAEQLIRIPAAVTPNISDAIDALEKVTSKYYPDWQQDVWLKGALALPLDENLSANLGDWQLRYSPKFGLSYEKEDDHGRETV